MKTATNAKFCCLGVARPMQRGQAMVETALVLIFFLLITLTILEFSRVWMINHVMGEAVRTASRLAAVTSLGDTVIPADGEITMASPIVENVYDYRYEVIDLDLLRKPDGTMAADLNDLFDSLPLVNQILRAAMVYERWKVPGGDTKRLIRLPGAMFRAPDEFPEFRTFATLLESSGEISDGTITLLAPLGIYYDEDRGIIESKMRYSYTFIVLRTYTNDWATAPDAVLAKELETGNVEFVAGAVEGIVPANYRNQMIDKGIWMPGMETLDGTEDSTSKIKTGRLRAGVSGHNFRPTRRMFTAYASRLKEVI